MALLRFARRSLDVGVLDAQDERAALAAREQPVEQRRARIADMEVTGRGTERNEGASWRSQLDQTVRVESSSLSRPRRLSSATAWHAIASPRPVASTVSLVLPLTLTARRVDARAASARFARIASTCGRSFGRSAMTVTSTLPTREPALCTTAPTAARSSARLSASFHSGSVSGNSGADVAGAAAPSIGVGHRVAHDVGVGVSVQSASRTGCRTPPRISGRPGTRRWRS